YYLADVARRTSRYNEADSLSRRALAIRTKTLGPRHAATAEVLSQLSFLDVYRSNLKDAEVHARRALEIRREALPANDVLIAFGLEQHAATLRRLGNLAQAEAELREALAMDQAVGGTRNAEAAGRMLRVADIVLEAQGDTALTETLMRSAVDILRKT